MFQAIAQSWLTLQCGMIPSVTRAVVTLEPGKGDVLAPTASWPAGSRTTTELNTAGKLAMDQRSPVVRPQSHAGPGADSAVVVASPLLSNDRVFGVVVMALKTLDERQQHAVVQLLKWGSALLEFMLQQGTGAAVAGRLAAVVETSVAGLEQPDFKHAATAAASHLAQALVCERVSIGFLEGGHARVRGLSHSAKVDRRSNLIADLEAAMDEALDEGTTLTHPNPGGDSPVAYAHDRLLRHHGDVAICTVLLHDAGEAVGAMTFERLDERAFDVGTVELCEAVATLLGPVLELKRLKELPLSTKTVDAGKAFAGRLLGRHHLPTKLSALAVLALAAFLGLATGEHRVASPATLEGTTHRAMVAPIDGYIAQAEFRAGNVIREGDVLAMLDRQDLELELRSLSSERNELLSQHRRAIAKLDRAEAKMLDAQVGKVESQMALMREQLDRTRIVAPFDGVIVTGDLSHSLGAPVERGQILFELAPLDSYRMTLEIAEDDISDVETGQRGTLVLSALPQERFTFIVEQIVGIAHTQAGRNAFRVEGRLENSSAHLRPGMKGVAKIGIERRKLAWVWTHNLTDRVRLWFWARLP